MLLSWISIPPSSDFSLQNLPFGVFSPKDRPSIRHCATIVGDTVVDLAVLEEAGLFDNVSTGSFPCMFSEPTLNEFVAKPKPVWTGVRQRLLDLLVQDGKDSRLEGNKELRQEALYQVDSVILYLPIDIAEYTDFYSSREHATNVGTMFRGKDNALQPNWLHLPVGYHGRASTVSVSGHSFPRPFGQLQVDANDASKGSVHGPCKLLDFELEVGTVVGGPPNEAGSSISMQQAKDRIFGFFLLNDWSARDIQKYEYVPLGPFTSKNFATTVSPWIVTSEALEPFRCSTSAVAQKDPEPLEYLRDPNYSSYNVVLTVSIKSKKQTKPNVVCRSNFRNLYWNSAQQLVHHSVTGCKMMPGDVLGSGTISGSSPDSFGSMLELSWKGSKEVPVGDEKRKFLQDGDTVILQGMCGGEGGLGRVGFGDCAATILPAKLDSGDSKQSAASQAPNQESTERYKNFKLYGYWRSSSTWRVRIALAFKSVQYETIPVNLLKAENKKPEYVAMNPMGQVPMLECFDCETQETLHLTQSSAIVDFLEEIFPDRHRLIPRDAAQKAIARQLVNVINSGTQPLQNQMYLSRIVAASNGTIDLQEEAKYVIEQGLGALEVMVKHQRTKKPGPFCMGSFSPTIVDLFMVPQLFNARRFHVDLDRVCPTLVSIEEKCSKHPLFLGARPENQPDALKE